MFLLVFVGFGHITTANAATDVWQPLATYLTWRDDPCTTLVVQWHTEAGDNRPDSLQWRPAGAADWQTAQGTQKPFPGSSLVVHFVDLTELDPDHVYEYRFNESMSPEWFRTMPLTPTRPIRFAVAGDVLSSVSIVEMMLRNETSRDPDFVMFCGDIAQENGDLRCADRWSMFLGSCTKYLITPQGRRIPILVAIGNHDVANGGFGQTPKDAPFFYGLFALANNRAYNVLDFGQYLSVFILDSGHTNAVAGAQKDWLEDVLEQRKTVTHKFAAYHVPAWPAYRRMGLPSHVAVRENWIPLFERYGLTAAFEHHEHCYKRTYPIKNGQVDPHGVLYMGNGGIGERELRRPVPPGSFSEGGRWFLARTAQANQFVFVTVDGPIRHFQAVDPANWAFDECYSVAGQGATIITDHSGDWLGMPLWISLVMSLIAMFGGSAMTLMILHVRQRRMTRARGYITDFTTETPAAAAAHLQIMLQDHVAPGQDGSGEDGAELVRRLTIVKSKDDEHREGKPIPKRSVR
ncbi:MAG: metallophosphoesterase family protein [Phycisphaeraceae bacterium]|nr:metallophosphoesterase family protein [Phycisphaeraceae bacterium]